MKTFKRIELQLWIMYGDFACWCEVVSLTYYLVLTMLTTQLCVLYVYNDVFLEVTINRQNNFITTEKPINTITSQCQIWPPADYTR